MITEIKEHHIDLKRPKIICDKMLDPTSKQLQEPLPNTNHTMLFIGKPRSGKSSLAFSLLELSVPFLSFIFISFLSCAVLFSYE